MLFAEPFAAGRGLAPWLRLLVVLLVLPAAARAANDDERFAQLVRLASDDRAVRQEALQQLGRSRDGRLVAFFAAYQQGDAYVHNGRVVLCPKFQEIEGRKMAPLSDPLSANPLSGPDGSPLVVPDGELKSMSPSGRERRAVNDVIRRLEVWSPQLDTRLAAIRQFGNSKKSEFLEPLGELVEADVPDVVRSRAIESIALIELGSENFTDSPKKRMAAAARLGEMCSAPAVPILDSLLKTPESLAPQEREAFAKALETIEWYQWKIARVQNLFQGLSLGSVLILVALGLAIIFGQMGVINMAHGELMMIGAYATYEIQMLFGHTPDNPVNLFFVVALPAAFLSAALVGWLIELLVVRHLYGRPLETLLATWGVGLILIQSVRMRYGDNIGVNSPDWLIGRFEPIQDLIIPYNRIFIMGLCATCVLAISAIMNRTRPGLLIRATVQNRETAESLGINTRRTDGLTFALGAGLAGIAGYAWTLIGTVAPEMGQGQIVDAFLVVVTGGVGELAGTVLAGLGLGVLNKMIEPAMGSAIWAKVILLLLVIAFIQWKPAGLFPPKGRLADV